MRAFNKMTIFLQAVRVRRSPHHLLSEAAGVSGNNWGALLDQDSGTSENALNFICST